MQSKRAFIGNTSNVMNVRLQHFLTRPQREVNFIKLLPVLFCLDSQNTDREENTKFNILFIYTLAFVSRQSDRRQNCYRGTRTSVKQGKCVEIKFHLAKASPFRVLCAKQSFHSRQTFQFIKTWICIKFNTSFA